VRAAPAAPGAPSNRVQYTVLAVLSLMTLASAGVLSLSNGAFFRPYFGPVNPLLAAGLVIALGFVCLRFLHSRGWFEIFAGRATLEGVMLSAALAALFAAVIIVVDLKAPFPLDMNVPPPQSFLFYPAIGHVAEIVFHALPLSLLLILLGPRLKKPGSTTLAWSCMVIVSCLEPIFHLSAESSGKTLSWAEIFVGPHVFLFNLLQLWVARRYDFVSMYSFRLVYYILWHIVWGYARLV
jgi:uncharacterized membrane protein